MKPFTNRKLILFFANLLLPYPLVVDAQLACTESRCQLYSNSLRFFVLGDWGGRGHKPYYTPSQKLVANAMKTLNKEYNTEMVMAVGDNMYDKGVTGKTTRFRFKVSWEDIYEKDDRPWYAIAGNHDYMGDVEEQIEYGEENERWVFPSPYYKVMYRLTDGTTIDLVMIDTVLLCGVLGSGVNGRERDNCEQRVDSDRQRKWIKKTLAHSKADYLLVFGHHPLYSVGKHGSNDCLQAAIHRYIIRYGVNVYFAGHDHNLQHLVPPHANTTHPVHYIVSGGGSRLDGRRRHESDVPKDSLRFMYPDRVLGATLKHDDRRYGGVVYVSVTKKKGIEVKFHRESGEMVYETVIGG